MQLLNVRYGIVNHRAQSQSDLYLMILGCHHEHLLLCSAPAKPH
jgi:hypothetical protein